MQRECHISSVQIKGNNVLLKKVMSKTITSMPRMLQHLDLRRIEFSPMKGILELLEECLIRHLSRFSETFVFEYCSSLL